MKSMQFFSDVFFGRILSRDRKFVRLLGLSPYVQSFCSVPLEARMSDDVRVLELLIKNADKAVEFGAVVKTAAKSRGKEFFSRHAIGETGLVGLKEVDPKSDTMQCSYGL